MGTKQNAYKSAPLPFMGQKRRFINQFKEALEEFPETPLFVDLFGGSGLLSHTVKQLRPEAMVVYNDFDDYHVRLLAASHTNEMLEQIRVIVGDSPREKKLSKELKRKVIAYLKAEEAKHGFLDYITLSSSLLFSMNYATDIKGFETSTLYNCVRKSPYSVSGYLDGLFIVKYDYKALFDKYRNHKGVVFLVDPPYLSTEQGTYNNYWRLSDYLDVLKVIKEHSYFYFTSDKSNIIELCDWLEGEMEAINPFKDSKRCEMKVSVNHNAGYTDMMLYKNIRKPDYYTTST